MIVKSNFPIAESKVDKTDLHVTKGPLADRNMPDSDEESFEQGLANLEKLLKSRSKKDIPLDQILSAGMSFPLPQSQMEVFERNNFPVGFQTGVQSGFQVDFENVLSEKLISADSDLLQNMQLPNDILTAPLPFETLPIKFALPESMRPIASPNSQLATQLAAQLVTKPAEPLDLQTSMLPDLPQMQIPGVTLDFECVISNNLPEVQSGQTPDFCRVGENQLMPEKIMERMIQISNAVPDAEAQNPRVQSTGVLQNVRNSTLELNSTKAPLVDIAGTMRKPNDIVNRPILTPTTSDVATLGTPIPILPQAVSVAEQGKSGEEPKGGESSGNKSQSNETPQRDKHKEVTASDNGLDGMFAAIGMDGRGQTSVPVNSSKFVVNSSDQANNLATRIQDTAGKMPINSVARIEINDANLGKIKISLRMGTDKALQVELIASGEGVREQLEKGSDTLKSALNDKNILVSVIRFSDDISAHRVTANQAVSDGRDFGRSPGQDFGFRGSESQNFQNGQGAQQGYTPSEPTKLGQIGRSKLLSSDALSNAKSAFKSNKVQRSSNGSLKVTA